MRRYVYIFTECGHQIGYGHLTRCIALYDELITLGLQAKFILNTSENTVVQMGVRDCVCCEWYDEPWETAGADLNNELYAIVDSYIAGIETYKKIAAGVKHENGIARAIYIDDTNRLEYPSGIIVNPSLFGEELEYNKRSDQIYLLGPEYIILRKEFHDLPAGFKRQKVDSIKNVLITMGGADIKNLTPKIMSILNTAAEYNNCMQHVVIGKGFDNIDKIKAQAQFAKLYYDLSATEMRDLMLSCDAAISAAGQTVHELLATTLPFVCIKVADNQEYNIRGLLKHGIIDKYLDFENKTDLQINQEIKKIPNMLNLLSSGCNPMDKRHLKRANYEDIDLLFNWTNDDEVRANSFNPAPISYDEHKKWFESKNNSKDSIIFIYYYENVPTGQIRIDVNDDSAIINYSIDKKFRFAGHGKIILQLLETVLKRDYPEIKYLYAKVKHSNAASQSKFEQLGYEKTSETDEYIEYHKFAKDFSKSIQRQTYY